MYGQLITGSPSLETFLGGMETIDSLPLPPRCLQPLKPSLVEWKPPTTPTRVAGTAPDLETFLGGMETNLQRFGKANVKDP